MASRDSLLDILLDGSPFYFLDFVKLYNQKIPFYKLVLQYNRISTINLK
jgi:hypothetical protein